tara:strand:- start:4023 stop:4781 length:759 start_codon:yes stop_codon:yes gene_type:complete
MEQGIYELPLNERLRTFMRIEFLYSRLKYFASNLDDNWQTRTVIHTLLEVYSILSRTDVRREVLADLDRYIIQMQRFQSAPDADNDMVNHVLEDLDLIKDHLVNIGTDYLMKLREDEFIASLLHRHTLPGGKAEFDMPKYKYFLESDKKNVSNQIEKWTEVIKPICEGIDKLMWIIRESNEPIATIAVEGQYNHQIERRTQISLVRIIISDTKIYPEISGGRHLIAVRFFKHNEDGKYIQFEDNVEFKISLC